MGVTALPPADAALRDLAAELQDSGYRFTTVTPLTHRRVNNRPGNRWARDLRGIFGWSRRFHSHIVAPPLWALMQRAGVVEREGEGWRCTVRLSTLGGRCFVHSAYPTRAADAVFFGPDTYRFDTAIAAHLTARTRPVHRAADIGCGAGAGAIRVAASYPEAEVLAVDLNTSAVRFTCVNAALAGTDNVRALCSDLLEGVEGKFDLIVANPPYLVDPDQRAYRHGGGALGADVSLAIVETARQRLVPGGTLVLYTGVAMPSGEDPFWEAVRRRLAGEQVTWTYREVDPDVFGEELLEPPYTAAERIAAVVLTMRCRSDNGIRRPGP